MLIADKIKSIIEGIYFITLWKLVPPEKRKKKLGIDKSKYYGIICKIEEEIISRYLDKPGDDKHKIAEYINQYGLTGVFPYEFCYKYYLKAAVSLGWDKKNQLYYIKRKGKKIYLKHNNYRQAFLYSKNLLMEQDKNSPHRYVEDPKTLSGKYLFDCGAAEGIFALDNVQNFEHIYLFEADNEWIKALQFSCKPFEDKITIVNRYLSDSSGEMQVTIDNFVEEKKIDLDASIFIKMDVEGMEDKVLKGAEKLLNESIKLNMAVCTYHKEFDEKTLYELLRQYEGMNLEFTRGYMILYYDGVVSALFPDSYIRRGVLRAEKRRE